MKKQIMTILLCLCLVAALLPTMVLASDDESAIQLGTDGIRDPTKTIAEHGEYYTPTSYIYYGEYGGSSIKWRVLDADKTNTGADGMFLLSEFLLDDNIKFGSNTTWVDSTAQKWCKDFAGEEGAETNVTDAFSAAELAEIQSISKTDDFADNKINLFYMDWDESILSDDKVFFLSTQELANYVGNYSGAPSAAQGDGAWWLRSKISTNEHGARVAVVLGDGFVLSSYLNAISIAARPAFNLDLNSVLFTSAAAGGKSASGMGSGLAAVTDTAAVTDWKLTMKDTDRTFSASLNSGSSATVVAGNSISVDYSNAKTGSNEYISAMIVNSSGKVFCYGRIAAAKTGAQTISVNIPSDLAAGSYTLKIFNEQFNGDDNPATTNDVEAKTDYASAFQDVALTVKAAPSTPTVTSVKVTPATASVVKGGTASFAATVTGTNIPAQTVNWTVEGGVSGTSISTTGVLTVAANETATALTVKATSTVNTGKSGTATVTVTSATPTVTSVKVTPATASVVKGGTASFAATVTGANSPAQTVNWTVEGGVSGTSISTTGVLTVAANETATALTVKATSTVNTGKSGTAAVTVTSTPPAPGEYTITFDGNGGTNPSAQNTVSGKLGSLPTVYRSSYRFTGWYTAKTEGTQITADTVFTEDTTVFAHWLYNGGGGGHSTDYYTLTFNTNEGTITAPISASSGTTIDLCKYTTTRHGYAFEGWYTDKSLTEKATSIKLTRNTVVYAKWTLNAPINTEDHVAYVAGYTDGTVQPNANITRAETATMLYRLLIDSRRAEISTTHNSFSDMNSDLWYNQTVSTMTNGGYISGYADGTFGGNKPITRAEFITMLVRFIGVDNSASADFYDVSKNHWAYQYIATAAGNGWVSGYSNDSFGANQGITRAEAMAIINRILGRGVDADSELLNFKVFSDNNSGTWYYYEVIEASNTHDYTGSRPSEDWTSISK